MKCLLKDFVYVISGGTPKTSINEYWNGDIPWISIKDFNYGNIYIKTTEKSITKLGLEKSSTNILRKNDIIISARGTVGCLAIIEKEMPKGSELCNKVKMFVEENMGISSERGCRYSSLVKVVAAALEPVYRANMAL